MELSVLITSCFCESAGAQPLICPSRETEESDLAYEHSLFTCADRKCFNPFGHDAFETVTSRMPDLCYYFQEEAKTDQEM